MSNLINIIPKGELDNLTESIRQALIVPEDPAAPFYRKQDKRILANILEENKDYLRNHTYADLYCKWSKELLDGVSDDRLTFVRRMNVLFDEIFDEVTSVEANTIDTYNDKMTSYKNLKEKGFKTLSQLNYDIAQDVQKGKAEDFSLYQSAVFLLCLIIDDLYVCIEKEQPT